MNDQFITSEQAAKEWNVSTKTISRWRKQGLQSTKQWIDSRCHVVIHRDWLAEFLEKNPQRVEKGRKFSQMTPTEREEIIERAKRMAAVGNPLTEVIRRLHDATGRSVETIRYTLKNYDRQHPREAIFPKYQRSLTDGEKQELLEMYRRGAGVDAISQRFSRTRTSVYRIIAEMRARRIQEMVLDPVVPPEFSQMVEGSDEENALLSEPPATVGKPRKGKLPSGLPAYLASLYTVPLLTFEQEQHLFRKMNYLKFRAEKYRRELDMQHPISRLMDQIERDFDAATEVKNQLVTSNLRLVVSIAKRHTSPTSPLFDLISDGNMSLIRAVEKFDYSRRNRFSTYASWAIMKNYSRALTDQQRYHARFVAMENEGNIEIEQEEYDHEAAERYHSKQEKRIAAMLKVLTPREQQIIIRRFGLNRDREPLTLKQVGQEMGVTKERIRQIEILAINKLREAGMSPG
ncbi:MAG: sigma-70 family RNA polymerase sigma factor [Planctomycetia bacterium]|nr:sigma-70 family RNA polymerase sigma factor [Planctomycetia bacterium]